MAELLIIIGVSGFIISTLGLMHEAASRGHSALFFLVPLASLGQVQQHWEEYRWWALGRVASLLTAAVGVALFLATGQTLLEPSTRQNLAGQAGQVLRGDNMASSTSFVTSEKAALLVVEGQGKALSGRLHGQRFRYDRVALIDGVLTASQGEAFLPELEVRILLGWNPQDITERRSLLVNPSDEEAPVVHLSWKPDGQDYPETRIFSGGYRLELALAPLLDGVLPHFAGVSDQPRMRRDLAFVVEDSVPAGELVAAVRNACDERLTGVRIFDIYQGDSIGENRKSLALGLTFQDRSRTLKDQEVNDLVEAVVSLLKQQFNATLRD